MFTCSRQLGKCLKKQILADMALVRRYGDQPLDHRTNSHDILIAAGGRKLVKRAKCLLDTLKEDTVRDGETFPIPIFW